MRKLLLITLLLSGCATTPATDYNAYRVEANQIQVDKIKEANAYYDSKLLPPDPKNQVAVDTHNVLVELKRTQELNDIQNRYNSYMQTIDRAEVSQSNYQAARSQAWSNLGNTLNSINTQNQLNRVERNQRNQNYQLQQIKSTQPAPSGINPYNP